MQPSVFDLSASGGLAPVGSEDRKTETKLRARWFVRLTGFHVRIVDVGIARLSVLTLWGGGFFCLSCIFRNFSIHLDISFLFSLGAFIWEDHGHV